MTYPEFFESLTGHPPHPWQERLADDLISGRSVILRVPTGAGKTWGAVAPFLYGMRIAKPLSDRLLYALPLRSLASSLHATVHEKMGTVFDSVRTMGKDRDYVSGSNYCSLQIGGQKDDPFFESDLVFTTIDQLLSSYIFIPVSLPDRLGNINAGALIGSLIVFDELHLLDPDIALGTTIEMLDRLKGLCQFVLMTATMSDDAINLLAAKVGARVAQISDNEIRALPSQRTKQRTWRRSDELITAEGIRQSHTGGRTIVLVNSVARAQDLFLSLQHEYERQSNIPGLILLHSRFYSEDREPIERRLDGYFGPNATTTNVILVATQVIEAGMDFSADQLHTEIAPMNALIQRAGRTARYEFRNLGSVTVYEAKSLGPYRDQTAVIEATREELKKLPPEGKIVDFFDENAWIRTVHSDAEKRQLREYSLPSRRKDVHDAMDHGHRGLLTRLVRDISSVNVLIAEDPQTVDFSGRAWPRLLGVPGFSLFSLSPFFDNLQEGQWVAKGATQEQSETPGFSLQWSSLTASELPRQWLVAIHPDFASYDPHLGLLLGTKAPAPPIQKSEPPATPRYQYEFETWVDHANRVAKQNRAMRRACVCGTERLARLYKIAPEMIEQISEMVCMLHDAGKLADQWQRQAWAWQDDKDSRMRARGHQVPARLRVPVAHTWFDPATDREWQRNPKYKLPPHAVEGAYAVANGIQERLTKALGYELAGIGAACAYTSIARHHGPRSSNLQIFKLGKKAQEAVGECEASLWGELSLSSCDSSGAADQFSNELLKFARPDDLQAWPLYTFAVRRLRLADQASLRR